MANSKALIVGAAGCAALCIYVLPGDATPQQTAAPVETAPIEARPAVTATPAPELPPITIPDLDIDLEDGIDLTDDTIHGLAKIDDPAEFAFMFRADDVDYLQLSTEDRATRHGRPKLIASEWDVTVIAPVDASALPEKYRGWVGRTVLVEGACKARVTGFAEVSRVSGSPPYEDDSHQEPVWTVDAARNDNVTLAARVEGCARGLWARAASAPSAPVARTVEEPALASSAKADLVAKKADDSIQKAWTDGGGEGDWRDAATVTSQVFEHGSTGERWVIARAHKEGGCGDPWLDKSFVYRANDDGSLRKVAELSLGEDIHDLVDLDHDGQPELVLGGGDSGSLVDLAGEHHGGIHISFHGCGC